MPLIHPNRYAAGRPIILALTKVLLLVIAQLPLIAGAPVYSSSEEPKSPNDASLWLDMGVAAALVLGGGAFAGLTIALMGQDEIYLQVIEKSGEGAEKKNAASVLKLLRKGKHWVLVTLLLSNVITNETLPIVIDRSLGGGWPAVLGSTVLIVIFGEIVPQSICVRYGLPIGAWCAPCVLVLMYIMSPVAWPVAKLLDRLLGEDHGTIYKKAGLKTLVTLHKTLGAAGEQLNSDEVTIISAVLDLKDKTVGSIMTPMNDVFTMSADTVLNEETMDLILSQGYSRIPIHAPDNPANFVGMLLVKMLITYDPEDCKQVRDFALATLPETRAETSCLDIVNFFQEGKSHMVLVSEYPGEDHGALGVVTLEDVIEELIGEEIIDESDVFIDVHKAIRRLAPAPKSRVPKGRIISGPPEVTNGTVNHLIEVSDDERHTDELTSQRRASYTSPAPTTFYLRKMSTNGSLDDTDRPVTRRGYTPEIREQLKHLGPSNLASRPRQTRYQSVKIKPGVSPTRSSQLLSDNASAPETLTSHRRSTGSHAASSLGYQGGIGEGLMTSAGLDAKDGVQALQAGYGSLRTSDHAASSPHEHSIAQAAAPEKPVPTIQEVDEARPRMQRSRPGSGNSASDNRPRSPTAYQRGPARSGSITEQIIDMHGVRKVILQTTSSSSSGDEGRSRSTTAPSTPKAGYEPPPSVSKGSQADAQGVKKKRRRKKRAGKSANQADGETEPLLD